MADILHFGKKAEDIRIEREEVIRQRKIDALKKIFQCSRCVMKCAKCGAQIEGRTDEPPKFAAPYAFCKSCREEYEEYRAREAGSPSSPFYWHNSGWMNVWRTWLEHQRSLDSYRHSKEFLQLMEEVELLLKQ